MCEISSIFLCVLYLLFVELFIESSGVDETITISSFPKLPVSLRHLNEVLPELNDLVTTLDTDSEDSEK